MKSEAKTQLVNYPELLQELKSLLTKAKYQAYKAVDNLRVQTYWQVGERIVREELEHKERADYGKYLVENLARDLGFSKRLLYEMVLLYRVYPIVHALYAQLSWNHYRVLLRLKNKEERVFYEQQIIEQGWSARTLQEEVSKHLYRRIQKKGGLIIKKKFPVKNIEPEQIFKEIYHFDFLELKKDYQEKDLKEALLEKLEQFLQELGPDFFVGKREVPILIGGNYDKIDLELFHAGLLCYVLVEVKTEPFQHKHVSQMYSYLNWYKQNKMQKGQRLPIGLIVCKTKDEETVHYALGDLKKEIFIAEYSTRLPSKEKIKRLLQ
ncbi:MAG: PDDEXK nuclease domain-containing protein [Nanoarchaeota archaeon]